jgi:hypothetical protein
MATAPPSPPWKQNIPHYLAQARHNFRLYQKLKDEGEFLDWAVTALFYTVLHLIQACLLDIAGDAFDYPTIHEQRDAFIRRKLSDIWLPYNFLQNQSTHTHAPFSRSLGSRSRETPLLPLSPDGRLLPDNPKRRQIR